MQALRYGERFGDLGYHIADATSKERVACVDQESKMNGGFALAVFISHSFFLQD